MIKIYIFKFWIALIMLFVAAILVIIGIGYLMSSGNEVMFYYHSGIGVIIGVIAGTYGKYTSKKIQESTSNLKKPSNN